MTRELHELILICRSKLDVSGQQIRDKTGLSTSRISDWARKPLQSSYNFSPGDHEKAEKLRALMVEKGLRIAQDERTVEDTQSSMGEGGRDSWGDSVSMADVPQQRSLHVDFDAASFDALGEAGMTRIHVVKPATPIDPLVLGRRVFQHLEEESNAFLDNKQRQQPDLVEINVETNTPIGLANFSDLHLGHKGTNHRRAREDAELIARTPGAYAVFGGDGIDNFIKHHSAMVNKGSEPESEYAALEWWLSLMKGKMLGGCTGNHEFWTKNFSGVDYLRAIMRRLGINYAKHRLRLVIRVNGIEYRVELRHSYRFKSSINYTNQFNRMWEMSDWEWDIGMVGHTHDGPWCAPFQRHGRERWGSLSGCYKEDDSHSQQWGFNDARPSTPFFILAHDRYSITGINDLRKGIHYLNALRMEVNQAA